MKIGLLLPLMKLCLILLALPCQLFSGPQARHPSNVILVTVDTLRSDYVGLSGHGKVETPFMDSLAADGAWFENAYCQVPLTPPSHASILTGSFPKTHGMRDFTSGPLNPESVTLAAMLRDKGYSTAAFVSALVLDSVWGLDRGFQHYGDDFGEPLTEGMNPGNVQRRASETIDRVLPWLSKVSGPYFLWVHLFDPHHDYDPPEPFRSRYAQDLYAGEVAYVDSQLGRLIGALKEKGDYDRTLLVLTSDHGESLGEHGEPNHGLFLYETTWRVPMIFKPPAHYRVSGRKVEGIVQTVDIVPTVLQTLRFPLRKEWRIEGKGRLAAILGKNVPGSLAFGESLYALKTFGWSPLFSLRQGRFKYIDSPSPELYDLEEDPGELNDLFAKRSALGERLRTELHSRFRPFPSAEEGGSKSDPEAVARLSALGYVTVSQAAPVASLQGLPDPKAKLPLYRDIVRALEASEAGDFSRSNSILRKVARQDPKLFIVHYSIGTNLLKQGKLQESLAALGLARGLNPDFQSIDLNRARALAGLKRVDEAIGVLQELVKRNPAYHSAQHQLGGLLVQAGRPVEAEKVFARILEGRPDDHRARKMRGIALVDSRSFANGLGELDAVVGAGRSDALVQNYRGIALANLGRDGEAVQAYRQALELNPGYHQARLNLAFTLKRSGNVGGARKEFDTLCRSNRALCDRYRSQFGRD